MILSPAVLSGSSASVSDVTRKRKSEWVHHNVDFSSQLSENGPSAKVPSKDRDRRKSQGESKKSKDLVT
jgi:hypothetical protein